MALKDDLPKVLNHVKAQKGLMDHNAELFDIYEGALIEYIIKDLAKQLSKESLEGVVHRIAPVNVLKRLVDKLSRIYAEPPKRFLQVENAQDKDLFDEYTANIDPNTKLQLANEFFNTFKTTAIEPYVSRRKPAFRILPSDRFTVYSNNPDDPTIPTHFVKFMGKRDLNGKPQEVLYVYTDTEFLPVNMKGEVFEEILLELNNPLGLNPIGRFPVVYLSRSQTNLIPPIDSDTLKMTKLFPVLITDLNFAVMYQCFSIIYGIDVDDQNIRMSPNSFWRFKSDPTTQSKPEVGVIKPQVDIAQVVSFIMSQLAFWLQSRNIRPGSVGSVSTENFASGVSKVVDEMDTYEERQKQIPIFTKGELELWDLVMHGYHPYWVAEDMIDETRVFQANQKISVEFAPQRPMIKRQEVLADVEKELSLGLTTRKESIQRLNPQMTEEQIDEFIQEIEEEASVTIPGRTSVPLDDHVHETPGGLTGPMEDAGPEGHYHTLPSGIETSKDPNTHGHTHGMPDGARTGPAKPLEEEQEGLEPEDGIAPEDDPSEAEEEISGG